MDGVQPTPPTVLGTATAAQHRSTRDLQRRYRPTSSSRRRAKRAQDCYHYPPSPLSDKIHGIHQQVLADLLLPKPALFEQLFDLTLGEHRLIGWPVSLPLTPIVTAELPVRNQHQRLCSLISWRCARLLPLPRRRRRPWRHHFHRPLLLLSSVSSSSLMRSPVRTTTSATSAPLLGARAQLIGFRMRCSAKRPTVASFRSTWVRVTVQTVLVDVDCRWQRDEC